MNKKEEKKGNYALLLKVIGNKIVERKIKLKGVK